MQIKNHKEIFFIPSGITVMKKNLTIISLGNDDEKLRSSSIAGKMHSDTSTLGSCFGSLFYIYTYMWPRNFTPKYTA